MKKYVPCMYSKSIFDVNYDKIKNKGITSLIFDLDNTLILKNGIVPDDSIVNLLKKLKNKFKIFILSNNINRKRVFKVAKVIGCEHVSFAMKPLSRGFRIIKEKYNIPYNEMCVIGDQILTDILGGNKLGILTVLVDPLGKEELKITSFNRLIEKRKIKKMSSLGLFERGRYYE